MTIIIVAILALFAKPEHATFKQRWNALPAYNHYMTLPMPHRVHNIAPGAECSWRNKCKLT